MKQRNTVTTVNIQNYFNQRILAQNVKKMFLSKMFIFFALEK